MLASSALLGLIVGLAARQSVANLVAGISIAVTQPIRIGDRITFDETTGRVENITLAYTYLDPGDGRLMVIPNEHIVGSEIFNHSTGNLGAPDPHQHLAAARRGRRPPRAGRSTGSPRPCSCSR